MISQTDEPLRIALIGAGFVGTALALQFIPAGHRVTISNSRGRETLWEEAKKTGAEAMDIEPALSQADVVIIGIPMTSVPRLRDTLQSNVRPGTIVIDSGNYYPLRDGRIESLDKGLPESQWVSETLGFPVVKAFNNIISVNIGPNSRPKGAPDRSALPVSADNEEHKKVVMRLVDTLGFDPYDAGSLSESWRQEPGQPAYCTEPSLTVLPGLLHSAVSLEKASATRDRASGIIKRLPPDFSGQALMRVSRFSNGMDRWKPQSWFAMLQVAGALVRSMILG